MFRSVTFRAVLLFVTRGVILHLGSHGKSNSQSRCMSISEVHPLRTVVKLDFRILVSAMCEKASSMDNWNQVSDAGAPDLDYKVPPRLFHII